MAQNANTNATKALNGLNKFNLSNSQTISQSGIIGQTNIAQVNESAINIISDSTNEVFKLYGNINATASEFGTVEVSIQSNLRPNEEITIVNAGICMYNTESHMETVNMTIQTNGIIKFASWLNPAYLGNKTFKMVLLNCLYFLDAFEQIVPEQGQ